MDRGLREALAPWAHRLTADFGDDDAGWLRLTLWWTDFDNPRSWPVRKRQISRAITRAGYRHSVVDLGDHLVIYVSDLSRTGARAPLACCA